MLDATKATESSHLSLDVVAAKKAFLQAMKTVYCVHNDEFRCPHEMCKLEGRGDLAKRVNLLSCNPRFSGFQQQDLQNSYHGVSRAKSIEALCKFPKKKLETWTPRKYLSFRRTVCFLEAVFFCARARRGGECSCKTEVFEAEQKPSFISLEHVDYLQEPPLKHLLLKNNVKRAIHFWSKRLSFSSILARLRYDLPGIITSMHLWWTKHTSNVSHPKQDERAI